MKTEEEEIGVEQEVKEIMADLLGMPKDEITDKTSFKNAEAWDSLKHMEIIAALEERYDILLTADEIVTMLSFGKIKTLLKEKISGNDNGN